MAILEQVTTARTTGGKAPRYRVEPGIAHPLGAIPDDTGVNFCVYADRATAVQLLLFDEHDDVEPFQVVELDPTTYKTFKFWHVYVRDAKPGLHYAYRVDGPHDRHGEGDAYNKEKVLIDPYARGNTNTLWERGAACTPGDNLTTAMRSVVIDTKDYDWEGDRPLNRPLGESVIYEMHVRGFTKSPTARVANPGTFSGVIEKIPYLKELGITAVELLPVFDFDEKEIKQIGPEGQPLPNYWGYDPINFFCPQNLYCVSPETGQHVNEFRDMVKALHRAGIEVILDVVFNHTGEGNELGPMINLKGFANDQYYILSCQDRQYYMNYSGCGNTLNTNEPITEKLVIDSLEYWATEMHVDGFRFDEAVILCRDKEGRPLDTPPVIWQIELSDILADTKVIAEAWDAAGLYEVGYFPGYRWAEWNGRYRDAIRHFVKGDTGYLDGQTMLGRVAAVISGSADIYQSADELPINSINFINVHDGFTLNDLVSYNEKHNEANGEHNQDGIDNNVSWNCGIEGPTDNAEVEALRKRQIKNFITILMVSQGVPMFVAGDEIRRTQQGNNNAYCQDSAISWFDWQLAEKNRDMFRFFKQVIAFRKSHRTLRRTSFFTGATNQRGLPDIAWHGCLLYPPDWNDANATALSFTMGGFPDKDGSGDTDVHVMMNMHWQDLTFELPKVAGRQWYRVIDTATDSPNDIADNVVKPDALIRWSTYQVKNRSVVVLISR